MTLGRRQFIAGSALGAIGALAGGTASAMASTPSVAASVGDDPDARLAPVPFEGRHQAGVLTPAPPFAAFVAFDVTAADRQGLTDLLQTITSRARRLTAGGPPPAQGGKGPPSDSGTLGPDIPADGLTVTLGVGSTLFDGRFGLSELRPIHLVAMSAFPNDELEPAWCGGDLLLQICAGSGDTVLHAVRDIAKYARGAANVRWRMDGFLAPPRPSGVPRNHLGFMDGIANPDVGDPAVSDQLLWVVDGVGERPWAVGGTYHAVRLIRMFIESWDRVSLHEQQAMIGRDRASGAPLGLTTYTDTPDYGSDPSGREIPLTAHMRLANPRTAQTEPSRIYRRSYNYDLGIDATGDLNMGLVFSCFQQDVIRQFEATQRRLINEPLAAFISPFGGGYFFVLPGVRHATDWLGRGLLQA